jgi:putative FmdB family regulatory protein
MPTYTFVCPECNYKFTDMFSMKDASGAKIVCPKCKNRGLRRVYEGSFSIGRTSKSSKTQGPVCPTCPSGVCPIK